MRDGAEVFDELLARHADAGIGDGERSRRLVRRDFDGELALGLEHGLFRELRVAELFERVARVGDELAQEDILVLVDGVRDDVEHLFDFRLKCVRGRRFCVTHNCSPEMQKICQGRRGGVRLSLSLSFGSNR